MIGIPVHTIQLGRAQAELTGLAEKYPLGEDWRLGEPFLEMVDVEGLEIFLVGLTATGSLADCVTGAAASSVEFPVARAYFELLERTGTVLANVKQESRYLLRDAMGRAVGEACSGEVFPVSDRPEVWTFARSNGVAVYRGFEGAAAAARLELLERDRVLRSWFGQTLPQRCSLPSLEWLLSLERRYEIEAYTFPCVGPVREREVTVAGVFAFPRSKELPFAYGLGAARAESSALCDAGQELLQGLGFLWGESIPQEIPKPTPTPSFHQEYYLCPANHPRLRSWLRGSLAGSGSTVSEPDTCWSLASASGPVFVDVTPTSWGESLSLVKALPLNELPLTFGLGNPRLSTSDPERQIHPVT